MSSETRIAFRTCPLCEAGCGLEIALHRENGSERVGRIRGDRDDVFSHGFICPKGSTLRQLHEDPDWLRGPLVKRDGRFEPASWDEAFAEVERRLLPIVERHGRDAVGMEVDARQAAARLADHEQRRPARAARDLQHLAGAVEL